LTADGEDKPDFILNQERYAHAPFLLTGRDFGCGSSRGQAPKALRQWGFRVLVAPSFCETFYVNCFRNGNLPAILREGSVQATSAQALSNGEGSVLALDVHREAPTDAQGPEYHFASPSRLRRMPLAGLDEIALTMTLATEVAAYRVRDEQERAWRYGCV
jgi:3-isopropylmalate/(R)-2-methylmalate dehydratase small subunit